MKKLIARRPIQYLGRAYEYGAALPANDSLMVEAWLKAGSAAWEGPPSEEAPSSPGKSDRREAERQTAEVLESFNVAIVDGNGAFVGKEALTKQLISVPLAETQTANTLRTLGVELTDEEGYFIGEERLKEQLCALAQDLLPGYEDILPPVGSPADGALPEEGQILETDPDGHFSRASLSRLTKAELLDLAEDLGVDLSGCRTNPERVEALAAVDAEALLEAGEAAYKPEAPPPEGPEA